MIDWDVIQLNDHRRFWLVYQRNPLRPPEWVPSVTSRVAVGWVQSALGLYESPAALLGWTDAGLPDDAGRSVLAPPEGVDCARMSERDAAWWLTRAVAPALALRRRNAAQLGPAGQIFRDMQRLGAAYLAAWMALRSDEVWTRPDDATHGALLRWAFVSSGADDPLDSVSDERAAELLALINPVAMGVADLLAPTARIDWDVSMRGRVPHTLDEPRLIWPRICAMHGSPAAAGAA